MIHITSNLSIDDEGIAKVGDEQGWPVQIGTANAIITICQKYIEQNTAKTIAIKEREYCAEVHPGMYEQCFGEPLPAKFSRKQTPAPVKERKETYVYVMKDRHTGYHKIGRSDTPKIREGTLQSQKPSIELLCYRKGTAKDENELQLRYQDKRWRGEWFDLDDKDIAAILVEFSIKGGVILEVEPDRESRGTV